METLKDLRTRLGISQPEIAKKIGATIPFICNVENGNAIMAIEDCTILENNFSQKINWLDPVSMKDKLEIMGDLTELSKGYPLSAVLTFAQKYLREGEKIGSPAKFIHFFREQTDIFRGTKPLLPPIFKDRKD